MKKRRFSIQIKKDGTSDGPSFNLVDHSKEPNAQQVLAADGDTSNPAGGGGSSKNIDESNYMVIETDYDLGAIDEVPVIDAKDLGADPIDSS